VIDTGTRTSAPLVLGAAAGVGVLALAQFGGAWLVGRPNEAAAVYGSLAALVIALLAWHRWPRPSCVVLLVLGALCTTPTQVFLLAPESFQPWMQTPYVVVSLVATPLLLVGLLGAATIGWRAGRRRGGTVLIGAALVVVALAGRLVVVTLHGVDEVVPVIGLVLITATVLLTMSAAVTGPRPAEPQLRPPWRVTVAGAAAGVAPLVNHRWRGPGSGPDSGLTTDEYFRQAGQHALTVGLVVLGAGLLAGVVAGARVFVAGVAAGLLMGALYGLARPEMIDIRGELSAGALAIVAAVALAGGVGLALVPARVWVGAIGLGVVACGLAALWLVSDADDPILGSGIPRVLVPALAFVAVVAAVAVLASLGAVVADTGAAPAAFAGVAAAVAAGFVGIATYFSFSGYGEGEVVSGIVPPVIVALVCAAGLAVAARRSPSTSDKASDR
jgi:hypothetical protein